MFMKEEKKQKKKLKLNKRFEWRLPIVMAERRIFKKSELHKLLTDIGIEISTVHVGRIFKEMPDLLNTELLLALMQVLNCTLDDLIRVVDVTPGDDNTRSDDDDAVEVILRKETPRSENSREKIKTSPVTPQKGKAVTKGNLTLVQGYDPELGPGFGARRDLRAEALKDK
jgi:DNA-binding Xre family transcriptional regulator